MKGLFELSELRSDLKSRYTLEEIEKMIKNKKVEGKHLIKVLGVKRYKGMKIKEALYRLV